jgi:hypothetical protein
MGPLTKHCPRCDRYRSIKCFYKNATSSDGYQGWCSQCYNAYRREKYRYGLKGEEKMEARGPLAKMPHDEFWGQVKTTQVLRRVKL